MNYLTYCLVYCFILLALFCLNALVYGIEHALYDVTGHTFNSLAVEAKLASLKGQRWVWNKVDDVLGGDSKDIRYF